MSIFKNLVGGIDHFANSINPMKQPMQWLTDNTIGKIPGVGKPGAQLYDYSNSHPLESLAAMAAIYGGASALGGGAAGGGAGGAGAGVGEGGLGTASGFGGVGVDGGVTGYGGAGMSSGFGGVGSDAAVTGFDGTAGALGPSTSSGFGGVGTDPSVVGSGNGTSSGMNWQGMAKQLLKQGMSSAQQSGQGGSGGGGQYQGSQQTSYNNPNAPQQQMAHALMIPDMGNTNFGAASPQGNSSMNSAMMAAQLLRQNPNQPWNGSPQVANW